MKTFLESVYETPIGRLARRFVATTVAAFIPLFVTRVGMDPVTFIDNIIGLNQADWTSMLKIAVGAGVIMGFDKLRREKDNLTGRPKMQEGSEK